MLLTPFQELYRVKTGLMTTDCRVDLPVIILWYIYNSQDVIDCCPCNERERSSKHIQNDQIICDLELLIAICSLNHWQYLLSTFTKYHIIS